MDALHLIIYVTGGCTRRCPDCYYPKEMGAMSADTAFKVAKWTTDFCKNENVKMFKTNIVGGEPLLNTAAVFILLSSLQDLPAHPDGRHIIFTNGDLLSEEVLRQLKKFRGVRILLNPTDNSLEKIETRMKLVISVFGKVSLSVVADKINLCRLSELAALAVKYKGHIRINRLYNGGTIPGYIEQFGKEMHKVFDILLSAPEPMWPNFILESTYPTWEGPKNPYSCGKWLFIIDPDGTIRSCNPDMSTVCGHIDTHAPRNDFSFAQRWSAKNLPECQQCEWVLWCQGGCPYTRKLTWGTYDRKTPFCSVFRELFPKLEMLKNKWLKHQKKFNPALGKPLWGAGFFV